MTTPDRTRIVPVALAAMAAFASFAPSPASAADYDMDCKLLLCLPAGFPSGCGDALDHMRDRLRDGKSPIGTCAMSNGAEYDAYKIDYAFEDVTSPAGWACPEGKHLYHRTSGADDGYWSQTVNTFCYDNAYQQNGWTPEGDNIVTTYTDRTAPARRDVRVNLTLEPGTDQEYSQGWQRFDTGRTSRIRVRYTD